MTEYNESKQQNILLEHVIFPRVLPQKKQSYIYEQRLIGQIIETVEDISDLLPQKTVEMMKRLKRVNSECTPTVVSELINELRPGDTFSMFVRKQNTVIMFYVPNHTALDSAGKPDNIVVATFSGCLHPHTIYEHDSDTEVNLF